MSSNDAERAAIEEVKKLRQVYQAVRDEVIKLKAAGDVESANRLLSECFDAAAPAYQLAKSAAQVARRGGDIVGEITAASGEQSDRIGQVNIAVNNLDQMTQQNAALVEESAAAAGSLKEQAQRLAQAVSAFKLETRAVAA